MKQPTIRTLDLSISLVCALLYLAVSLAVLRFIAPAFISSQSTELVLIGFALVAVWLIGSAVGAYHLFKKRRTPAATTKEENL